MAKKQTTLQADLKAIRAIRRAEAIADGSYFQNRAATIPDGRKKASKNACRRNKYGRLAD